MANKSKSKPNPLPVQDGLLWVYNVSINYRATLSTERRRLARWLWRQSQRSALQYTPAHQLEHLHSDDSGGDEHEHIEVLNSGDNHKQDISETEFWEER